MKTFFKAMILMACFGANADVYKCHGTGGKILYQQEPCPGQPGAKPLSLDLPPPEVLLRMQQEAQERELRSQSEAEAEQELKETAQNDITPDSNPPSVSHLPVFIDAGYPRYLPFFNLYHPPRPHLPPTNKGHSKDADSYKKPPRRPGNLSHPRYDVGGKMR